MYCTLRMYCTYTRKWNPFLHFYLQWTYTNSTVALTNKYLKMFTAKWGRKWLLTPELKCLSCQKPLKWFLHRLITYLGYASSLRVELTLHHRIGSMPIYCTHKDMLCEYGGGVMPDRRAGSGVGKSCTVQCTMPRAQNRFNFITKTLHFCPSRYIIYLWVSVLESGTRQET